MPARSLSKYFGRILTVGFSISALCTLFSATASAQLSDKKTMITFATPVEIPDAGAQVLPAGTYVFKLVDSKTDRNIVQILSKDESHVFATILAIPNYRLRATDKTVMTFAERAAGQPQALRAWFYPGERTGQEFVYPKTKAAELAKVANLPVPYIPDEVAVKIVAAPIAPKAPISPAKAAAEPVVITLREAPVLVIKPTGEVVQIAEVFEAPPVQVALKASVLPKTAGELPLIALMGFLSLIIGIATSKLCAR
jgi:hypothetical protein